MNVTNRHILMACLKVFDLFMLTISYGLSTLLLLQRDHSGSFGQFMSMRIKLSNFLIFVGAMLTWHVVFATCGLYKSKRLATHKEEMISEWKATTLATICLLLVAVSFHIRMVTPPFLVFFWGITSVGVVTSRFSLRQFLGHIRVRGRNLRYILILGTNPRAMEFARRIEITPEWGYRNLGFVDHEWAGSNEFRKSGFHIASGLRGLPDFLRKNVVDEVAVYLPLRSFYGDAAKIAALCEKHGIIVRFDSDIFGLRAVRADEIETSHAMATRGTMREGWPLIAKRALDILSSLVLLTLLLPLLVVVAILIRITSPGPVFFRQERVGLNKRRFLIFKFRTMVPEAEKMMAQYANLNEVPGPVFKIRNDPRITPVGKWLRRSSIDELPQLLNVLKGDMSLVGPRPLPVRDYEGFGEDWQRRRFCVRPGITCLWQVQGRSSVGFEQWMRMDMKYLDEWSLWLDLKILVMTIPAVLKGSGAA
jgi:exopolysaccharide biosynthesis polyprenyl glycosylphosphotransferase